MAYNPRTGRELWRLSNNDAQVITPTPIVVGEQIVITGGNPTGARPIHAVRAGGTGDLTPATQGERGEHLDWTVERGSPYTPTPIAYRGIL